jgi:hypothetical protein
MPSSASPPAELGTTWSAVSGFAAGSAPCSGRPHPGQTYPLSATQLLIAALAATGHPP